MDPVTPTSPAEAPAAPASAPVDAVPAASGSVAPAPEVKAPLPAGAGEAAPADAKADSKTETGSDTAPATESEPSLLGSAKSLKDLKDGADKPAEEPAPADAKPEGDAKPDAKGEGDAPVKEALAEKPPAAPKAYEPFKLPDGVKLGETELKQFTDIVGADQVKQETAQKLVDLYLADVTRISEQAAQHQQDVWRKYNDGWKTELRNDPDLGGNRLETTLAIAKAVIEQYGGTKEQAAALIKHGDNNGMSNYAGFVRLLHNVGEKLNVFEDFIVPAAATAPKSQKGPGNRGWYKETKGNGAANA